MVRLERCLRGRRTHGGKPKPTQTGRACRPLFRGFTLTELLIVIAIVTVLAGMLLPVFGQTREKARQTACLSNCRQLGQAIVAYTDDHDEAIVPWIQETGLPTDDDRRDLVTWVQLLLPYTRTATPDRTQSPAAPGPAGILRCPSFNEAALKRAASDPNCNGTTVAELVFPMRSVWAHYGLANGRRGGSCTREDPYLYMAGNRGPAVAGGQQPLMTLAMVNRPAETALVTDGVIGLSKRLPTGRSAVIQGVGCEGAEAHLGGGHLIFLDGHAKWFQGNTQRSLSYLKQDPADGCWYQQYYSVDRPRSSH